jgi:thiamine-monophosphate kinase
MTRRIDSEEALIARYLAPLAAGTPGALGLRDDCATLACPAGEELVLTVDAVAEGVHFLASDSPRDVAWKALAVNVSDLAGKGARPIAYLMALSFPEAPEESWLAEFSSGLEEAQQALGLKLTGGDTDRRPGPLTITITAIGSVPVGRMVQRCAAQAGDRLFVSGTLGDGALGLMLLQRPEFTDAWCLTPDERAHLVRRYRRPEPRLALGEALRACASAAMDISDGLAKDLARMCVASGCGARVEALRLPLSPAARKALAADPSLVAAVVAGGDDYEILAAVPETRAEEFRGRAAAGGLPVTGIGEATPAQGVSIIDSEGKRLPLLRTGWDHFG